VTAGPSPLDLARRRVDGTSGIDDWGFDRELRDLLAWPIAPAACSPNRRW
jgi:hypothetical protein